LFGNKPPETNQTEGPVGASHSHPATSCHLLVSRQRCVPAATRNAKGCRKRFRSCRRAEGLKPVDGVLGGSSDLPSGYDSQFALERSTIFNRETRETQVNHLFLWAIYTMAMLVITRG